MGRSGKGDELLRIRYLMVHQSPGIHLYLPPGVWVEDTLGNAWLRLGGPRATYRLPWRVRIDEDTFPVYLGDDVDTLDLAELLSILNRDSLSSTQGTSSKPLRQTQRIPRRWSTSSPIVQDTLTFVRLAHLSPSSLTRLEQTARQLASAPLHRLHIRVEGAATPEGDPLFNQKLARWRALEVVRSLLRFIPEDKDVTVDLQTVLNASGKWAYLSVEGEP
jgi:hypothetical protein